jgi:carboxymethylenebutenolidase
VSDLRRYIVEEWAEAYHQGRMPRRELLRRIAMMAGGVALATPVLQSLGLSASSAEIAEAASSAPIQVAQQQGITVPPDDPAIQAEMVTYQLSNIQAAGIGYLARPKSGGPYPGVVVVHENRGLLEHYKDVCRRFAKAGYAALAIDLAAPAGGTARFSDSAQVATTLGQMPPEQIVSMCNDAVPRIKAAPGVRQDRIGTVGWCFGGGVVWRFVTANPELKAAVPFYGPNPPIDDVPKIKAAILAIYGALDTRIDAGIPAIREAMQKAGVTFDIQIYPDANHAFFNDTGGAYKKEAAEDAWRRTLAWFDRYLKM